MEPHNFKTYLKYQNWKYQIMELKGADLDNEILKLTRTDIVDWLQWNDRNGVYRDDDSIREFGSVMSIEEGIEIMTRQIEEA